MIKRGAFLGGLGTAAILLLGAALNWFFTPISHADASGVRQALVVVQALIGLVTAVWAFRRVAIESRLEAESSHA